MVSHCKVCDRLLTSKWAALGIGPVCAKKIGFGKDPGNTQGKDDTDDLVPYDGGDLFIERVNPFTSESGVKDFASGCRSNVPRQIYRHSPTGYNFGYAGSGPADFALNCCLLVATHADDAYRVYQDFKRKFVEVERGDRLVIPRAKAEQFFKELGISVKSR